MARDIIISMSEEILLGGKTYVSSKRAARECGYAQDYVGQLARSGVIDAQRVGGLWYVSMESLQGYKQNADMHAPKPPAASSHGPELDTIVSFDGKDYISASRASKITGYNPDYVGQLARGGKVLSRQIGNRWYVERDGLLSHKAQKDSMLARVQAESVGLTIQASAPSLAVKQPEGPYFTYIREDDHLMPVLNKPETLVEQPRMSRVSSPVEISTRVPIRVVKRTVKRAAPATVQTPRSVRRAGMTMSKAAKAVGVLTVVVVLSYGFSTMKSDSIYAFVPNLENAIGTSADSMTASVSQVFAALIEMIEKIVSPALEYSRE